MPTIQSLTLQPSPRLRSKIHLTDDVSQCRAVTIALTNFLADAESQAIGNIEDYPSGIHLKTRTRLNHRINWNDFGVDANDRRIFAGLDHPASFEFATRRDKQ